MNEISENLLEKLRNQEYEEYAVLRKKCFDGENYMALAFLALHLAVIAIVLLIFSAVGVNEKDKFGVYFCIPVVGILFPLSYVVTLGIVAIFSLERIFVKIYEYFAHKTSSYIRFKEFEELFDPIERQIEKEVIPILTDLEVDVKKRLLENRNLNSYLGPKRKRELYLYEINKVRQNCDLNTKALKIFDENIEFVRFDGEKLREFRRLRTDIQNQRKDFYGFLWNLETRPITPISNEPSSEIRTLPARQDQREITTRQFLPSDSSKESRSRRTTNPKVNPLGLGPEPVRIKSNNDEGESIDDVRPSTVGNSEPRKQQPASNFDPADVYNTHVQQTLEQLPFDFENPVIVPENVTALPRKRSTPRYTPIFKATPELRLQIYERQIDIGLRGELMVLEYERGKRHALGESQVDLEHSSVEIGDGLGYDIRSSENGKPIYIEVKTTTGSFWANLFFTKNEFKKMREMEEQYFLYRLWDFDVDRNSSRLHVFTGQKMIEDYFDFTPNLFMLDPKGRNDQ